LTAPKVTTASARQRIIELTIRRRIFSGDRFPHVTVPRTLGFDPKVERSNLEPSVMLSPDLNVVRTEGRGIMELETYGANGAEVVPEVTTEVTDSPEWPERAAQGKAKKSKLTWSQAKVSQLLESLGEIDAKRVKLDGERDEIKKQLATAVASL
jgi:hypothetical protein